MPNAQDIEEQLAAVNQSQQERLFHIGFRLYFLGSVNRTDLVSRFGIKEANWTTLDAIFGFLPTVPTLFFQNEETLSG